MVKFKAFSLLLLLMLTGCVVHYTDSQGRDRYLGFVSMVVEESDCILTNTTHSAGLTIDTTTETGGVNIGYRKNTKVYIDKVDYMEVEETHAGKVHVKLPEQSLESSRCTTTMK